METKACQACAIAKRRCGKQTPHCLRCRTRGIKCTYSPTKPSSFVLCKEDAPSIESEVGPAKGLQFPPTCSQRMQTPGVGDAQLSSGGTVDFPGLSSILIDEQCFSSWFTCSENWQVGFPTTNDSSSTVSDLERFIKRIFRWLLEWIETGSNSFIHARLYQSRFPRCIQDAYAALSCYFHRNSANKQIALRIIEDRAKSLVAENGNPSADPSTNITTTSTLDPLEQVSRVHALLIYQIIGLYDGDIRLRHLSEIHMPTLNTWIQEMALHSSQIPSLGRYLISSDKEQATDGWDSCISAQRENLLWYSWILTESIRRAWVVGSGIQVVFTALQQKKIDSCQGGMMITTRQGVWEAPSSVAWEKLCLEVHVGLMQMVEAERVFTESAPSEINEFTKVALEVVFGRDKMERWGVQAED